MPKEQVEMMRQADRITGQKRGVLFSASLLLGAAVLLGACVDSGDMEPTAGNMCKSEVGDGLWGGYSEGALNEGNGTVSFVSGFFGDNVGTVSRLHLVNCATGATVGIERAYYFDPLIGGGRPAAKDSEWAAIESRDDFFARLRQVADINDPEALRPLQTRYGFEVSRMRADSTSQHAICACKLYYPKATGDWATTQMGDASASN